MDLIALVTLWEQCGDIHVERLCEVLSTLSQDVGICRRMMISNTSGSLRNSFAEDWGCR